MAGPRPSNPLALAVLTLLAERPMHPYEMSTTLRQRRKEDSIKLNYGSLYSVVESLHKRGLVEARETVREGRRPERTVYAITEAGSEIMIDWLAELLSTPRKEFPEFEAALSLMAILPPAEVRRLLSERLANLRMQRNAYEAMHQQLAEVNFPRLFSIEADYAFALLVTEIDFVRELLDELDSGEFSGLGMWQRIHELRDAGIPQDEVEAKIASEFADDLRFIGEWGKDG